MSPRGAAPVRREQYLELRRAGRTHQEACCEMGLDLNSGNAPAYRRWYETETGALPQPPRRPLYMNCDRG